MQPLAPFCVFFRSLKGAAAQAPSTSYVVTICTFSIDRATVSLTLSALQTTQVGRDAPITCRIPLIGSQLCTEALLDIEYIKAVGGAIPLTDIFNKQFSCEALTSLTRVAPH